jgi:hypothetical protein
MKKDAIVSYLHVVLQIQIDSVSRVVIDVQARQLFVNFWSIHAR